MKSIQIMKLIDITNLIIVLVNLSFIHAALPINVGKYWFQITEDSSLIYYHNDSGNWKYSRLNTDGDIVYSITLIDFQGKGDLNDEYMIEEDSNKQRSLYIFSYQEGYYQKIDYENLLKTGNDQTFQCGSDNYYKYGSAKTRYLKREGQYVKGSNTQMSSVSQSFQPDQLSAYTQVSSFQKSPYYFQYTIKSNSRSEMYWKGKKYILQDVDLIRSIVIDYVNDILLSSESYKLVQLDLSKSYLSYKREIQLSSLYITDVFSMDGAQLFGVFETNQLNFYDLITFQKVQFASKSQKITVVATYQNLISYKNLIINSQSIFKVKYDKSTKAVLLEQLPITLATTYALPLTSPIWRTTFTQGQTQILNVGSTNQLTSIERMICKDNYFLNSNSDCVQCLPDEVFQSNQCQKCPVNTIKININDKICSPIQCGLPTTTKQCLCQNYNYQISSKTCIQCQPGSYFSKDLCQPCSVGEFYDGKQCSACSLSNCSQCKDLQTCHQCIDGYFLTASGQCQKCKSPCSKCNSRENQCTQCIIPLILNGNTCACPTQQFFNGNTCASCISNCIACQNDSQCTQCDQQNGYFANETKSCTKCQPNQIINEQKNNCICINGYYEDSRNNCIKCQDGCELCSINKCSSCKIGYYLNSSNQCSQCKSNCKKCSDQNGCEECNNGFILYNQQCYQCQQGMIFIEGKCQCPEGQFWDKINNKCDSCPKNCSQCSSKTVCTQMIQCDDGFINHPITFECIGCLYFETDFFTCLNKCPENSKIFNTSYHTQICRRCRYLNNQCVESCGDGYYTDKSSLQCLKCHPSCKQCNGPLETNCRDCHDLKFVNEEGKCSECEIGQFKNTETQSCQNCHWTCKECNGSKDDQCLSCFAQMTLSQGNQCRTENQKKDDIEEDKVCGYGGYKINHDDCQKNLDFAKLNYKILDKLSIVNGFAAISICILVPTFSPFAWFYIQQQQLIGNFAFLKSMNIMWLNQLQLKLSYAHNIINIFPHSLEKQNDILVNFSLFDNATIKVNNLCKQFVENAFVHGLILFGIIIFFILLSLFQSKSSIARKVISYVRWNLFIRFFMVSSNIIILSAVIEFSEGAFSNTTSLIFFIIIGIIYILFQFKSFRFQFSHSNYLRYFDTITLMCLKNGILDTQRLPRLFWSFFETRKIILSTLMALFFNNIYVPWISVGLSGFCIFYYIIFKPLVDKKANVFLILVELMFCFLMILISLQNQFSLGLDTGLSIDYRSQFIARCISGALLSIQLFFLLAFIYIGFNTIVNIIALRRQNRIKDDINKSHLIIDQTFKFENFDQIVTALASSDKNITWVKNPSSKTNLS